MGLADSGRALVRKSWVAGVGQRCGTKSSVGGPGGGARGGGLVLMHPLGMAFNVSDDHANHLSRGHVFRGAELKARGKTCLVNRRVRTCPRKNLARTNPGPPPRG